MSGLRADMDSAGLQQPEKIDFGFSAGDTWLDETPQKPAPVEETSEDVADWLRNLDQGSTKPPAPQAPAPAAQATADVGGVPDWLNGLEHTNAIPGATAAMPPAEQPSTSDWLSSLEASSSPVPAPAAAEPGLDWLGSLSDAAPAQPAAPAAATDLPDWLSDLGAPADETPSASASVAEAPDWLSNLDEPTAPAPAAPTESTPDWFASLSEPAAPAPPAATESLPDWMSSLGESAAPAATEAAPDWLSNLGEPAPTPTPAATESAPLTPTVDDSIPDWMRGSAPMTLPAAQESETELPSFEAPSWLSEETEAPAAAEAADMPAWLSSMAGVQAAAPETVSPLPEQPDDELLSGLRPKASAFVMDEKIDAGDAEALLSMDMPDWLSGMAPEAASILPGPAASESVEPTATLSDSELPSWVQAMRPVESMMDASGPTEGGSYIEEQGPLAGLRDVLPAPAGLFATPKPRAYANRLQLSDSHQMQANLLEALIAAEATPKPITTQKRLGSARLLRWALTVLVLLAVVVPVVLGTQTVPTISGGLPLPQSVALFSVVNALQPDAPVLLVCDYEPGLAGELEAAAVPVVDHLMVKGARLVLLSTSPTGPLLGERLLARFQQEHHYRFGEQYTNLGYLAGGPIGMAGFAANPQLAAPLATDNTRAWTSKALENVAAYADFSAVVVITDSADTGRAWIEQTAARLNGKPLLIIASAQAEPLLWPYYNSKQVQGLVSGVSGGAFYEVQTGQFKLGRLYWDAFSYSFALAELALLIGGLVSLIIHFRARNGEGDVA